MPDSITHIGGSAFANVPLEKVVLPKNLKRLEFNSFGNSNTDSETGAKEVILPESLEYIGDRSLYSVKNIIVPKNVQYIHSNAFDRTRIQGITFENIND